MCNNITDWIMVAITAIYVIATIIICIFNGKSAKAASKQISESINQQEKTIKVQFANKRIEILSVFDEQIKEILSNWDFTLNHNIKSFIIYNEICIYFDEDFIKFYNDLLSSIKHLNILIGDYEHSEKNGTCNGRESQTIVTEIEQEKNKIDEYYRNVKKQMIDRYLIF